MRKFAIVASLSVGFLFVVWIILRVTGVFNYYTASSPSNYPTFDRGDYIFASGKIEPQLLDMICFNTKDLTETDQVFVFRLCGKEGDVVEIKKGILLVNQINRDKKLNLSHCYMVPNSILDKLKQLGVLNGSEKTAMSYPGNDSSLVHIPDKMIKDKNLPVRWMDFIGAEEMIKQKFNADWTIDNFGPVKVPAGKYFVLGDSRHNALDSRYIGFIPVENYKGTVLNK